MLVLYLNILLVLGLTAHAQIQIPSCIRILEADTCGPGFRCEGGRCRRSDTSIRCSPVLPCPNPLTQTCQNGQCVADTSIRCSSIMPCPNPFTHRCQNGRCIPAQPSGCFDCEFNQGSFCENNRCVRGPGETCGGLSSEPCSSGHDCISGVCSRRGNPGCFDCEFTPGSFCENNRCVRRVGASCGLGSLCQSGYVCSSGICSLDVNPGCIDCGFTPGSICENNRCVRRPGATCGGLNPQRCSSGYVCSRGTCSPDGDLGCIDCGFTPGSICENNQCVRGPGATCGGLNSQRCSSGYVCRRGTCERRTGCPFDCRFNPGTTCVNDRCVRGPGGSQRTCRLESDCRQNERCHNGYCEPESSRICFRISDCRPNERCSQQGYCEQETSRRCTFPYDCRPNERCNRGYCELNFPTSRPCLSSFECGPNESCRQGYCERRRSDECGRLGRQCRRGYRCDNYQCVPSDPAPPPILPNDILLPTPFVLPHDRQRCGNGRPCQRGEECVIGRCMRVLV